MNVVDSFTLHIPGKPFGKLCECGCGRPTPLAPKTNTARGVVKGQPLRFINGHNRTRWPEPWEKVVERFWEKVDKRGPDECWEWQAGTFRTGYGQFKIVGQPRVATRVMWEIVHGDPLDDPRVFVCHRCDNPPCVNPAHLFLGDAAANNADMVNKGRSRAPRPGEGSCRKLTWQQVDEIRQRYAAEDTSLRLLGLEYGVTASTIGRAIRGESWGQ